MPRKRKSNPPDRFGVPVDLDTGSIRNGRATSRRRRRSQRSRSNSSPHRSRSPLLGDPQLGDVRDKQVRNHHAQEDDSSQSSSIIWLKGIEGLPVRPAEGFPGWLDLTEALHGTKHRLPRGQKMVVPAPNLPSFDTIMQAGGRSGPWGISSDGEKACIVYHPTSLETTTATDNSIEGQLHQHFDQRTTVSPVHQPAAQDIKQQEAANGEFLTIDLNHVNNTAKSNSDSAGIGLSGLVTAHVPLNMKQKIWGKEYLSLIDLLPEKNDPDWEPPLNLTLSQDNKSLVFKSTKRRQTIESYHTWSKCFNIFMAIYVQKHADEHQDLICYAEIIRKISEVFPNNRFVRYDKQFRYLKASNPSLPWSQVEPTLWSLELSFPSQTSDQTSPRYCYHFNNHGKCNRSPGQCKFHHACMACGKVGHPKIKCYTQNNTNNGKNSNIQSKNFTNQSPKAPVVQANK